MTLFEYIAIAFSLVFSVTVVRLISGLPHAAHPDRAYWVHFLFVVTLLGYVVNYFWGFWSLREVEWTYFGFVLTLSTPAMQYFVASVLVPAEPSAVSSWREHYFLVRRRAFGGLGAV